MISSWGGGTSSSSSTGAWTTSSSSGSSSSSTKAYSSGYSDLIGSGWSLSWTRLNVGPKAFFANHIPENSRITEHSRPSVRDSNSITSWSGENTLVGGMRSTTSSAWEYAALSASVVMSLPNQVVALSFAAWRFSLSMEDTFFLFAGEQASKVSSPPEMAAILTLFSWTKHFFFSSVVARTK